MIIKLDESSLLAAGFTNSHVVLMRHLVAQIGEITGQTTLPEVAALTDTITPIVNGLVITLSATNVVVSELQANEFEPTRSDHHLVCRLNDIETTLEAGRIERSSLVAALDDMQAAQENQSLNIAELRRRIALLEDAQS